ncbi:MAG: hypothetical protein GY754_12110 [bacterium]|nr:hypothetical protein [bacterium]
MSLVKKSMFMMMLALLVFGSSVAMAGEIRVDLRNDDAVSAGAMWKINIYDRDTGAFVAASSWKYDGEIVDLDVMIPGPYNWGYRVELKCRNIEGYYTPTPRGFYTPLWDGLLDTDMYYQKR